MNPARGHMAKRDSRPVGPGPDPPTAARQRGSLRGTAELCLSRTAPGRREQCGTRSTPARPASNSSCQDPTRSPPLPDSKGRI